MLKAGPILELLHVNKLEDDSSHARAGGWPLGGIRTDRNLYTIGKAS